TWTSAKTAAESRTFNGLQGYLATITSQAEEGFLQANFASLVNGNFDTLANVWIGASDAEQEGLWKWVTGPEVGLAFWDGGPINGVYENWDNNSGEPNNSGGGEDFAVWNHRYGNGYVAFAWNDLPNIPSTELNDSVPGYFVEYSGTSEVNVVTGIGVYQSSVDGGNGDDTITISGTHFGIKDSLISGNNGNDTFNVGRGQGIVDGGWGYDTLQIDYFLGGVKPSDITVRAGIGGDILISGTTDNLGNLLDANGNSNAWTQTIKGVEQFLVSGATYSAAQFISTFG
ncbi:MAG: lectin-like protein, partial [Leptolyngbyaceae cyanobacterium]